MEQEKNLDTDLIARLLPKSASETGRNKMLEELAKLVRLWREQRQDQEPTGLGALSGRQRRAVCLAAGRAHELADPVGDFLSLDGWLQIWVLDELNLRTFVGQVIGRESF